MTDSKDIVQRLRLNTPCFDAEGNKRKLCGQDGGTCPECRKKQDAADLIEAQAAEIAALKHIAEHRHPTMDDLLKQAQKTKAAEAERDEARAERDNYIHAFKSEHKNCEAAEAEVVRLREALTKVQLMTYCDASGERCVNCVARNALGEKP